MSFGPPKEYSPPPNATSPNFGPPGPTTVGPFKAPGKLVSVFDLVQRLKSKARELGFDDPEMSDKLFAEAQALEAGDSLEVPDREV